MFYLFNIQDRQKKGEEERKKKLYIFGAKQFCQLAISSEHHFAQFECSVCNKKEDAILRIIIWLIDNRKKHSKTECNDTE